MMLKKKKIKTLDEILSLSHCPDWSNLSNLRLFVCLLKTSLYLMLFKEFFVPDVFLSTFPFE